MLSTYGSVKISDVWNLQGVRRMSTRTSRGEVLDLSGNMTGIGIYGKEVAEKFLDIAHSCHVESPGYVNVDCVSRSADQALAEIRKLGYLVLGSLAETRYRVLFVADMDQTVKYWEQGLADYHHKKLARVLKAVGDADYEAAVPF